MTAMVRVYGEERIFKGKHFWSHCHGAPMVGLVLEP
jgi:hypothetical protein